MTKISNLKKGFTLIELITAIAIIGVLSVFVMANVMGALKKSRDGQRKADLRQIQSALEMYRADNDSYPTATSDNSVNNCPTSGTDAHTKFGNTACNRIYMDTIPKDPASNIYYYYNYDNTDKTYELVSCLENFNDPQTDEKLGIRPNNTTVCPTTNTQRSYTLKNP